MGCLISKLVELTGCIYQRGIVLAWDRFTSSRINGDRFTSWRSNGGRINGGRFNGLYIFTGVASRVVVVTEVRMAELRSTSI